MLSISSIKTLLVLITLCVMLIFLLVYVLLKKNKKKLEKTFAITLGLLIYWLICDILQIALSEKFGINPIYFDYFTYVSGCFLPVFFFFMALVFIRTEISFKPKYFLLFIVPIISLIVLWTNNSHHLFYKVYSTNFSECTYGSYFGVYSIYTYSLFAISIFMLLKYSIKNSGFFSKQAILLIIGTSIPLIINIFGTFHIISMTIYMTPIAFSITILFLFLAIFKFNFLGSTPIALQRIVNRISDGYIVLNTNYEISDYNRTFINTFRIKDTAKIRGYSFFEISKYYKLDKNLFLNGFKKVNNNDLTETFEIEVKDLKKYFNVEISSILNNSQILGILLLFKDITQHKKDMETIKDNQNMLIERERLSSLGQMIGGIAHNLKTPIMSISGAAEGLKDLADELDNSIGNPVVTNDDYHDIAKDMKNWISKIKNYSEYMSDVITAVKGQAVNFTNDEEISFTISELLKRVDILMKHELKNAIVYLNVSIKTDENTIIKGDVNSLVQIINNMLSNAIQAYNGKPEQTIELIVTKENSNCIISIQDHAGGLPNKIKDKLFKEMVTTKGKNGTGLGLYMSYSTIKAHFNGDITFESEPGKGTTFHIILPI